MRRCAEVLDVGRFSYKDMDVRPVFTGRTPGQQKASGADSYRVEGGGLL